MSLETLALSRIRAKLWLMAEGEAGSDPSASVEKAKASGTRSMPVVDARSRQRVWRSAERPPVSSSMARLRMLDRFFGPRTHPAPWLCTMLSSILIRRWAKSTSDHRSAQISDRRAPEAATTRMNTPQAGLLVSAASRMLRSSSTAGSPHLGRLLVQRPVGHLGVLDRVGQDAVAPFACQATGPVQNGTNLANALGTEPGPLEVAEIALHLVRGERDDLAPADGLGDVVAPDAVVAVGGVGTEVLPAVAPPAFDGLVDRGVPSPAGGEKRSSARSSSISASRRASSRSAARLVPSNIRER